jgi:hypothetical protein
MNSNFIQGEPIYFAHQLDNAFKEIELYPISDVHYGNPLFSQNHFDRQLKYILETPNAFCILNGDLCESSLRTSKGEIYKQVGTPQDQRDWIVERLYPLRHKILGQDTGNHEVRIWNEIGIDISADIARALGIPYRPEGLIIKISFGDYNKGTKGRPYTYWICFTHGYGGARTKGAKAVKVERLATWLHADCYIMSHDHVVNVAPDVYLLPDPRTHIDPETGFRVGRVMAHRKMLVKSNAYLKWGGYSEMGGFPPVDLDCPKITLRGVGTPKIKVEV